MITLTPPRLGLPQLWVEKRGAFLWWRLDVLGEGGNSLVLMWSYGLPFLPGYLTSCRDHDPPPPSLRPSLKVVIHRNRKPTFRTLQEYLPRECQWDYPRGPGDTSPHRWAFGSSTIVVSPTSDEGFHLNADLCLQDPGTHAHHRLSVEMQASLRSTHAPRGSTIPPPPLISSLPERHALHHRWSPLIKPTTATVAEHCERGNHPWIGRAYLDHQGSPAPFSELGIRHWIWGHAPFEGAELVYFLAWSEDRSQPPLHRVLWITEHETLVHHPLVVGRNRTRLGRYGMPWWQHLSFRGPHGALDIHVAAPVDDSPCALRSFAEVVYHQRTLTLRSQSMVEFVRPQRIDRGLSRLFVRTGF